MAENQTSGKELARATGRLLSRGTAMVAGLILMVAGLAMGVTIVMLPIGIPVGLLGLLAFVWGFSGPSKEREPEGEPHPQPSVSHPLSENQPPVSAARPARE